MSHRILGQCATAQTSASLVIILAALWLSAPLAAQINTGKITGIVTDSGGASIAGAKARATNEDTGVATVVQTQDNGGYLINFLIPGRYTVEVESSGFERSIEKDVEVTAGGTARLDFALKIGELRQAVEVQANPVAVITESAELSQTFGYKALDTLPNIDRNPLYQMNLLPGANNGAGSGNYGSNGGENGSAIGLTRPQLSSIGGVDANANGVYIEGIFNREPQNAYIGVVPPIEGVQELQVFAGKYDAEYGFSGSTVINVVTKSGTNEYHGAAFEFLRNNATDANNYFASQSTPFRRNQFGGAIGGPIRKNKLFFFADYQGTLFRTSNYEFASAPTAKMYNGDFSELYSLTPPAGADSTYGQLYDPFSRVFDSNGNVISASPFPGNVIPTSRFDGAAAKMNADHIFGVANLPGLTNNLYYLYRNTQDAHQGDGRIDFNESDKHRLFFRYSLLDSTNTNSTNINQFFQDGQANSHSVNQNMQLTLLSTLNASQANEARIGYNRTHVNTNTNSMDKNWNNSYGIPNGNLGDSITQGIFEISSSTSSSSLPPISNFGQPDWVAFIISNSIAATDNFTWVRGRHTFKFGANLNHIEDTSADTIGGDDPRGALTFDPAMTSYSGVAPPFAYPSFLLGTMTSSARARFVNGWPYQTYWQNAFYAQDDFKVLPSLTLNLGFRYELTTRPVERYNRQSNWDTATNQLVVATSNNRSPSLNLDKGDVGPRVGVAWSPDKGKTSLRAGFGISYWQAYWTGPLTILGLGYPNYAKQQLLSANNLTPSLSLSRDGIPLASAEYDSSGKLVIPANAVIRGTNYNWKSQEVQQTSVNLQRELARGVLVDVGYLRVRGLHNNHPTNINQATPQLPGVDYNLARPLAQQYPQLGDIPVQFSNASSWYDALTARLVAQLGNGITVSASYAHGRNFTNGNNIDQTNINQYYGPTLQDIAHIFTAQFSYEFPVGRGKRFLSNANRLTDALLGGWQYSGFLTIRSGLRFDVTSSVSLLNNGQTNRANRICNGAVSDPTVNLWFNTSCFTDDLTVDSYGNAGINPLHTNGLQQLDSSLFKTFKFTERMSLQFRADAFNTFNHPNFTAPTAIVGDPSEGQIFSTSVDNRRMQFGLRLFF
jgi:Carboxypeptidase regulatory-like domain